MSNIKNFKMFLEGYSEELESVLSNEENNFIVSNGDKILVGSEYLEDAFTFLGEILEGDSVIDEEQKYEFDDLVNELSLDDDSDQFEIDEFLNTILDRFEIVEPYKVQRRDEMEETPIENDDEFNFDEPEGVDFDDDDNSEMMLGESVSSDPFCIVGEIDGKTEEIDSFLSSEEAENYLPEYKTIYNEFSDMKIVHRDLLESNHMNGNGYSDSLQMEDDLKNVRTVCDDCGSKFGEKGNHSRQSWWIDKCDICKQEKEVTDVRHFNYLKKNTNESNHTSLSINDFLEIKKEVSDIVIDAGYAVESWLVGFSDQIENGTLSEGDIELLKHSLEQYDLDLDEIIDEISSNIETEINNETGSSFIDLYGDRKFEKVKSFKDFL